MSWGATTIVEDPIAVSASHGLQLMWSGSNRRKHLDFFLTLSNISASKKIGSDPPTDDREEDNHQHDDPSVMPLNPGLASRGCSRGSIRALTRACSTRSSSSSARDNRILRGTEVIVPGLDGLKIRSIGTALRSADCRHPLRASIIKVRQSSVSAETVVIGCRNIWRCTFALDVKQRSAEGCAWWEAGSEGDDQSIRRRRCWWCRISRRLRVCEIDR